MDMVKAVVGANWGDEGKGKITDQNADGMIDGLLQLSMILSHTDGERGRIEGFGQDTERY